MAVLAYYAVVFNARQGIGDMVAARRFHTKRQTIFKQRNGKHSLYLIRYLFKRVWL